MKYLIKYKKEFIITIAVFLAIIYILYDGFKNGTSIQSILESIAIVLGWYYNMPTSIEGDISKIEIKQRKACRNVGYEGAPEPEDAEVKE